VGGFVDCSRYAVVCCRPLAEIIALVRHPRDPQRFDVEYVSGVTRHYLSTDRDALLASLLDGVRAAGNRSIYIHMKPLARGERFQPLNVRCR
jgi:DnaJ family protein C protein 13